MSIQRIRACTVWRCALTGLADGPSLLAVAVLLLNDHVLKAVAPSWWTGKLSDFAGLVFFPFLVLAGLGAWEWLSRRRFRSPDAAMRLALALAALWFAALKLSLWTQRPALALLERLAGGPRVVVADPTDLIALAVLPAVWARWRALRRREVSQASICPRRRFWQTLALATAALAALATSPSPTPVDFGAVTGVAADAGNPDVFYAGVATQQILGCKKSRGLGAGNYCEPTAVDRHTETYRSLDGGRTWALYSDVGGYLWADPYTPERLFVLNEDGLHRLDGGTALRLNVPVTATIFSPYYVEESTQNNLYPLAFDPLAPDTLYLSAHEYFYVSRDGGDTWTDTPIEVDGQPDSLYALALTPAAPQWIYATDFRRVLRSEDGGQTWRIAGVPRANNQAVVALAVHPQNPNIVYAALTASIQRSADGGQTWDQVLATHAAMRGITVHPANPDLIYAVSYAARAGDATYISGDGGDTWTTIIQHGGLDIASSPTAPYRIVLAQGVQGVAILDESPAPADPALVVARTSLTPHLIYADAFAVAPDRPEMLYTLVGASRVWGASNDGGQSWITQTLPNSVDEVPATLVMGERDSAGRDTIVAAGRQTLYRFHPQAQGVNVEMQALPPDLRDTRPATVTRPLLYLPGARRWLMAGPAGVVYSDDDAQTWTAAVLSDNLAIAPGALTGTLSWPTTLAAATDGSPAYAAVSVDHALEPTQVLLRSDDGATWSLRGWLTQTLMTSLAVHPSAPDVVYGSGGGIYRSDDGGVTWQNCYTSTPQLDGTDTTRILALNERQVWAATAAGIVRSDDDGATWAVVYPIPQLYGPRVFLDAALAPDRAEILLLARPTLPDTPMPSSALPPIRLRYNLEEGWQTFKEGLPVHFEYHQAE